MSPKTPNATSPIPAGVKTVITPRVPQDIIDEILDHLAANSDSESLKACALVSRSWIPSCQQHLFHTIDFTSRSMDGWSNTFPVPEESPAHRVRDLRIWIEGLSHVPDKFFGHTPSFTNARKLSFLGPGRLLEFRTLSRWRLPESATSLTIDTAVVTLVEIRNIMAQLPNLDDLSIWGPMAPVERGGLLGIGTALRGRFGGKLVLRGLHCANKGFMDMLLKIPTGLHFTEVDIRCARKCLPSIVRFVEVCGETIVKLSSTVNSSCMFHSFSQSGWSQYHYCAKY